MKLRAIGYVSMITEEGPPDVLRLEDRREKAGSLTRDGDLREIDIPGDIKSIGLNIAGPVIRALERTLELDRAKGTLGGIKDEVILSIVKAIGRGEGEITIRLPNKTRVACGEDTENPREGCGESLKVKEAIRVITDIIQSQTIERAGECLSYYDAAGPKAHRIMKEKGVHVPELGYFRYEAFRSRDRFLVIATALRSSGMKGKIFYESHTKSWIGTGDIGEEWLPGGGPKGTEENEGPHHPE